MANLRRSGEWMQSVYSDKTQQISTPRVSNISCLGHGEADPSSVPDTQRSRIRDSDTEFVKIAKEGGRKDLLTVKDHQPTPSPAKYDKKGGDWYNQDRINNNGPPETPRSKVKASDTEFLKAAKEGGHKDLLVISDHTPTPQAMKYKKDGGDWYTHEHAVVNGKDDPPETPRSRAKKTDTNYVKTAKDGGHKDLLTVQEHKPTATAAQYKKKGGDWFPQEGVNEKDAFKIDKTTPASARVHRNYNKLQIKNTDTDYIKTAKKGGHSDLLKMPTNRRSSTPADYKRSNWFYLEDNKNPSLSERPKTAQTSRTLSSSVFSAQVDGSPRPRTSFRVANPIWNGGSGPELRNSPARRHISVGSGNAPYAVHTASRTSRNPDKI